MIIVLFLLDDVLSLTFCRSLFEVPTMSTVETNDSSIGTAAGSRTTDHHWRHRHGWEWCLGGIHEGWVKNDSDGIMLKLCLVDYKISQSYSNLLWKNWSIHYFHIWRCQILKGCTPLQRPMQSGMKSGWSLYNFYSWGRLTVIWILRSCLFHPDFYLDCSRLQLWAPVDLVPMPRHHSNNQTQTVRLTRLIIRIAKLVVAEISEFWHPMFLWWDDRMLNFDAGNRGAAVGFDITFSLVWQGTWCVVSLFFFCVFFIWTISFYWKIVMESLRSGHKTTC